MGGSGTHLLYTPTSTPASISGRSTVSTMPLSATPGSVMMSALVAPQLRHLGADLLTRRRP
jgi:hypothetical protein